MERADEALPFAAIATGASVIVDRGQVPSQDGIAALLYIRTDVVAENASNPSVPN